MWGKPRTNARAHSVSRTRKGLRALAGDNRGATIIEFALVVAPFVALILATIQTSLVFFAQQCLETTAEKTGRDLVTGSAQISHLSKDDFNAIACGNLPSFMKCENLMIDVQTASSFASIDTEVPELTYDEMGNVNNSWQFQPGEAGSIVVMRTMYIFPVVNGPLGFNLSNMGEGKRLLVATSVFKSEPYTS